MRSSNNFSILIHLSNMINQSFQSRIMMELNYMLSYGAAQPSISLLQRLGLLEILLPFHVSRLYSASCFIVDIADCRSSIVLTQF